MRLADSTYRMERACHVRGLVGLGSSRKHWLPVLPHINRGPLSECVLEMYRGFSIQVLQLSTADWRYPS